MSAEAFHPELSGQVIELFGSEALEQRYEMFHHKLGEVSVRLAEVNQEYHDIIQGMIELGVLMRTQGVDTDALARRLQNETTPLT